MSKVHQIAVMQENAMGVADWTVMDKSAYLNIASKDRVKLMLKGNVKFMDANGNDVPAQEALKEVA